MLLELDHVGLPFIRQNSPHTWPSKASTDLSWSACMHIIRCLTIFELPLSTAQNNAVCPACQGNTTDCSNKWCIIIQKMSVRWLDCWDMYRVPILSFFKCQRFPGWCDWTVWRLEDKWLSCMRITWPFKQERRAPHLEAQETRENSKLNAFKTKKGNIHTPKHPSRKGLINIRSELPYMIINIPFYRIPSMQIVILWLCKKTSDKQLHFLSGLNWATKTIKIWCK